jgi:hypothetical protein
VVLEARSAAWADCICRMTQAGAAALLPAQAAIVPGTQAGAAALLPAQAAIVPGPPLQGATQVLHVRC